MHELKTRWMESMLLRSSPVAFLYRLSSSSTSHHPQHPIVFDPISLKEPTGLHDWSWLRLCGHKVFLHPHLKQVKCCLATAPSFFLLRRSYVGLPGPRPPSRCHGAATLPPNKVDARDQGFAILVWTILLSLYFVFSLR